MHQHAFFQSKRAPCWKISAQFAAVAAASAFLAATTEADTYPEWKHRVFSEAEQADPAISGELAPSPAGDAIPNLLKYAFGIDPHQDGSLGLPQLGSVEIADPDTSISQRFPTITYQ